MKRKRAISITVKADDAERLKKLSPYSSLFLSTLVEEFFKEIAVEDVWASIEMDKPISYSERILRLRKFIKERMVFSPSSFQKDKVVDEDIWKKFKA